MKQPFYLVWNPATGQTKHRHFTKQDAENEANRLALLHRGQEFIVLAPVSSTKTVEVQKECYDYSDQDEIPF